MKLPSNLVGRNFVITESWVNTMCLLKWVTLLKAKLLLLLALKFHDAFPSVK